MKKIIETIAIILCLTLTFGCNTAPTDQNNPETTDAITTLPNLTTEATTAEQIETLPNIPGGKLTMTQEAKVSEETYKSNETYEMFLKAAEKYTLTPGLKQNTIPQGLSRNPKTGYLYVSSYSGASNTPSVILVMDPTGKFVAQYNIYNADETPFTGHVGGVAVTEDYLYFSGPADPNGYYTLAEFDLSTLTLNGSQDIKIENTVSIPIATGYLSYADGMLWIGNFYLKGTYDLGKVFNFTTKNSSGKEYGGYAAAYDLNGKDEKRLTVGKGDKYAVPDHVLATPEKVQGFAYRDGCVMLSTSYGRRNTSVLMCYRIDLAKPTGDITVDGMKYPLTILDMTNMVKSYPTMPMTEGLTYAEDGKILVLFESAAQKYSDSKDPTDYIWKIEFPTK